MSEPTTCASLEPLSVSRAREQIKNYIHYTPLLHSQSISHIASSQGPRHLCSTRKSSTQHGDPATSTPGLTPPKLNIFFKCENLQRTGAFKARGAFFAVTHLVETIGLESLRRKGVATVSSGNHAQGVALAASTIGIPAIIVMPKTSTKSKIEGVASYLSVETLDETGGQGPHGRIVFCGSSNDEKKSAAEDVVRSTGAIFIPPYDHPDIILGQGTCAWELDEQFRNLNLTPGESLDAVVAPIGGGGLLGGVATWFSDKPTRVFGAEPSYEGADDATRGLKQGQRIPHVSSSTIADGLRTPVGVLNWTVVSDPSKVAGVFAVDEDDIKLAMRLILERLKVVVEPSACVPLAVVLFNEDFRALVAEKQAGATWNIAIVLSGGNTTVSSIGSLFSK